MSDVRLTLNQMLEGLHPNEYGLPFFREGIWQGLCRIKFEIDLMQPPVGKENRTPLLRYLCKHF